MIDLKLDTSTHDLVLEDGDLVLIQDSEEVAQAVKIHLLTQMGEWILDNGVGVQWFDKIFLVSTPQDEKELLVKRAILSVIGVKNIQDFELDIDYATQSMTIDFGATTIYGDVQIEVST